eukprot:7227269-Pyramimonas_sp.AAC.1
MELITMRKRRLQTEFETTRYYQRGRNINANGERTLWIRRMGNRTAHTLTNNEQGTASRVRGSDLAERTGRRKALVPENALGWG